MTYYKIIYSFEVLDKIKEGHDVYALGRAEKEVCCMNRLHVEEFVDMLHLAEKEKQSYEFWIEVVTEEVKE